MSSMAHLLAPLIRRRVGRRGRGAVTDGRAPLRKEFESLAQFGTLFQNFIGPLWIESLDNVDNVEQLQTLRFSALQSRDAYGAVSPGLAFQVSISLQSFFVEAQELAGFLVSHAALAHGPLDVFAKRGNQGVHV